MTLNENEKVNFIKNNFHQYIDLTLKNDFDTTETVNLVLPMTDLTNEDIVSEELKAYSHNTPLPNKDIDSILSKYEDTSYEGIRCICTNVIDGDTIDIKIPIEKENGELKYKEDRLRLVGVNAPEENIQGYEVSKAFMEKVCYSKKYLEKLAYERKKASLEENEENPFSAEEEEYYNNIYNDKVLYVKIDKKKPRDTTAYNRLLGVLIVNNKNINEVLLKEKLAEIMYIPPSEFNPFDWGTPDTRVHIYDFENEDISILNPYFNSEMTNVVFTPRDSFTLYQYEFYKGVYYIKLNPFSRYIRMHLLPKGYDCSNSVLIFRDNMLTEDNVDITDDYYHQIGSINSYFLINNEIRDRTNISEQQYNPNDWEDTHCEFSYDISNSTQSFNNLEICAGYRYNQSSPYYSVHYTGVRDNTNIRVEDKCTLIDANFDTIKNISNNITQYDYNNERQLCLTKEIKSQFEENIDHVTNVGSLYHKIIKYINDDLYLEEKGQYAFCDWTDPSQ